MWDVEQKAVQEARQASADEDPLGAF